jgi:bifunctional UDP-N-acetylglucosamine pyrophosphorylase/glucosamine-1-phosphate N-acetyltransferase
MDAAIILAAGEGKRMCSDLPKVLHPVGELPMVAHVVATALKRRCSPVVVVIQPEARRVRDFLSARFGNKVSFALQEQQLGTGDAARVGLAAIIGQCDRTFILVGDAPLIRADTLARMQRTRASLTVLSAEVEAPEGYGRIVREGDGIRIVEEQDCTEEQRQLHEVNSGTYLIDTAFLRQTLPQLTRNNAQGEYYLTDVVAAAGDARAVLAADPSEIHGINDRVALAEAEEYFRQARVMLLLASGVTVQDPNACYVGADVVVERDVVLGVGVQLRGNTKVRSGATIYGPTVVRDSVVGRGAVVESFCHLDGARLDGDAHVGPFARLRQGAHLEGAARVGNFVELKNTRLGRGAKANHLAYLGDAVVGQDSNVGAGTITCNYDGNVKHKTHVGAGVFLGSNSTLVAPLTLGAGSYVAAGSTITQDVPKDALALGRSRQVNKAGYAPRLRSKK